MHNLINLAAFTLLLKHEARLKSKGNYLTVPFCLLLKMATSTTTI